MCRVWSLTLWWWAGWRCKWRLACLLSTLFFVVFAWWGILQGRDSWVTWFSLLGNGYTLVVWTARLMGEASLEYWKQIHFLTGAYEQVLVYHILYPKFRQDPWFGGIHMQVWGFGSIYSRRSIE